MRNLLTLIAVLAEFATPGTAQIVEGSARIVDGDTIEVAGQIVRLDGIDAPESRQTCGAVACGHAATEALRSLIGRATVTCTAQSSDAYDRLIGQCSANGTDLNAAMVESGHALAFRRYSVRYVPHEEKAQARNAGMWSGPFEAPWEYRAAQWDGAAQTASNQCPIKGNINRDGTRIYHTPYSRHYDRTVISPARGERWFCSEREALDAGWRAPFR
ncbi:endonuclease YncB(thermonuclease family) [Rubricella aquisinus]|uniref:Endonuclease YncB(Thermonuclease family) n=1 Tax=Rubricella aquisinus TaxID=2028108 RepID=A0A840WGU2_9RHOB|nr:thermonuclease family protein [Rubricella aquisinus]MBB5514349.1 endonuclease YncB(thermonuclease family) [Rubricella aquisinus]